MAIAMEGSAATNDAAFEAVAVRYVHDARNGEFLNIGVVMLEPTRGTGQVRFLERWARLTAAFPGIDLMGMQRIVAAFTARMAQLPVAPAETIGSLVQSVVADDDSSIQFSSAISGVTANPHATLEHLYAVYVDRGSPT